MNFKNDSKMITYQLLKAVVYPYGDLIFIWNAIRISIIIKHTKTTWNYLCERDDFSFDDAREEWKEAIKSGNYCVCKAPDDVRDEIEDFVRAL